MSTLLEAKDTPETFENRPVSTTPTPSKIRSHRQLYFQ